MVDTGMPKGVESSRHGTPWAKEELILAFDLYCRIPFKKTKANNPEVIRLAGILRRSPASVPRKLGNFGSFDPRLQEQNIVGLAHASRLDREVWDEFNVDWNGLVVESERLRNVMLPEAIGQEDVVEDLVLPCGPSEEESTRKARLHQQFFRQSVLSSYDETCCVTGLHLRECLVASHIVPWSVSEEHRADPRNGLCLSATFDRLFDRGLITVTDDLVLVVSQTLRSSGDEAIMDMICAFHGAPILRPRRFLPLPVHLEWHRHNVFHD